FLKKATSGRTGSHLSEMASTHALNFRGIHSGIGVSALRFRTTATAYRSHLHSACAFGMMWYITLQAPAMPSAIPDIGITHRLRLPWNTRAIFAEPRK